MRDAKVGIIDPRVITAFAGEPWCCISRAPRVVEVHFRVERPGSTIHRARETSHSCEGADEDLVWLWIGRFAVVVVRCQACLPRLVRIINRAFLDRSEQADVTSFIRQRATLTATDGLIIQRRRMDKAAVNWSAAQDHRIKPPKSFSIPATRSSKAFFFASNSLTSFSSASMSSALISTYASCCAGSGRSSSSSSSTSP